MHKELINDLAKKIHEYNVSAGWWDNKDECVFQKIQLISTEIAEATEGARKNLMDTHLHKRKMEEVEYADAMIRLLDVGGRLELTYEPVIFHRWCLITNSIGKQHMGINVTIAELAETLEEYEQAGGTHDNVMLYKDILNCTYSIVISSIIQVACNRNMELFDAIQEKRAYNAVRADHKRENREAEGGKKF